MSHASLRSSLLATFFVSSFFLHLLWENVQAPLYGGYESFGQHFWICLKVAAAGDMLFMLVIYLALATFHRNIFWVTQRAAYSHRATWGIAICVGILFAMSFEFWAVYIDHRWQYAEAMPLLPMLNIGLTPIFQMIAVPTTVLLFAMRRAT